MQLKLHSFQLHLKHTFTISRESTDIQDTFVVALSHKGHTGYGEATTNPYYQITLKSLYEEVSAIESELQDYPFTTAEAFCEWIKQFTMSSFARCALDLAAHDLWGKIEGKSLMELWGTSGGEIPTSNFTIGIDSTEKMCEKMEEQPWPIYKIKLGTAHDIDIVKELRKKSDAVFRVDANCAWSAQECIHNSKALKELGVEFIEQPLKANNWEGMKTVKEAADLPIIADESCLVEADVEKCAPYFHGINIKLSKCGGLSPARKMIAKAKSLGLKVMVGCMTESTVGISAIAQLLPELDFVDMDGALLLKNDIAKGVTITPDAKVIFPKTKGSGVELLPLS